MSGDLVFLETISLLEAIKVADNVTHNMFFCLLL